VEDKATNEGQAMYVFDPTDFQQTIELPFYEFCVPVPRGYDTILRVFYGHDWRRSNEQRQIFASMPSAQSWASAPPLDLCKDQKR
jgi:hypothetical protein